MSATADDPIARCAWPIDGRDRLAAALGAAAGLAPLGPADRFELAYADVAPGLGSRARAEAPAVLRAGPGAGILLGVARYDGENAHLLAPDGTIARVAVDVLAAWLRAPVEAPARQAAEAAITRAGLSGPRAAEVIAALLIASLGGARVAEGTRLRPRLPSIGRALRAAGLARRFAAACAGYAVELALIVGLWALVGARAVGGAQSAPAGWAVAVAIAAALVGARLLSSLMAGRLAVDGGGLLRDRILHGILALDTESVREAGIGQLMGRVADVEAVESLALGGGLTATAGAFELATGLVVLGLGVAPAAHLGLAAGWAALAFGLGARMQRALRAWSAQRLALTHDLVERMVGQRTLVAQEPPELWHRDEDRALALYAARGRALDRAATALDVLVPRGWLLGAIVLLAPHLDDVTRRPGAFAASLGGILFVAGAWRKLAQALPALGAAAIAWRNLGELLAGGDSPASPAPAPDDDVLAGAPLIAARDLGYRYSGRAEPALANATFEIHRGDRLLIEGPSAGGKSTLASLLAGLRAPSSGELRLDGTAWQALGAERWRARVGAAPQFHENHVFSASLLFNLLLGRAWPPRQEDVALAETICRELDLGPLLARMPSGLEQLVGDSGWQLSHGERGRLFIARALLQPLDARILDESFAALDPETLERALACVLARAETLIVIAHP